MSLSIDEIKILVKAETDKAVKGLKTVEDQSKKVSFSFMDIAKSAIGFNGVSTAINLVASAVKGAVKTIIEFDAAIGNVASISSVATEELKELALEAGKNTKFSATQSAEALYFLASAGIETAEVMREVLTPSLMLAAAGQISIQKATDVTVQALKVFEDQGLEAAEVADIMAQTVQSANTDMTQLAEAIKVGGTTAALAGQSFKDLNVVAAGLAEIGQKGSEGMIKYRQAIARLEKPVGRAKEILEEAGFTQERLNKLLPTPIKLFKELGQAGFDNAEAIEIFGMRQKEVFALTQDNASALENLNEKISKYSDDGGAAFRAQEIQLDTIQGQIDLLNSSYENIILRLSGGGGLAEALKEITKEIKAVTDGIGDFLQSAEGMRIINVIVKAIGLTFRFLVATTIGPATRSIVLMVKQIINAFTALSLVIKNVFKGDFEGAAKAAKEGLANIVSLSKETAVAMLNDYKKIGTSGKHLWQALTKDYEKEQKKIRQAQWQSVNNFAKTEETKTKIARDELEKRKDIIDQIVKYGKDKEQELTNLTIKQLKLRLKQRKREEKEESERRDKIKQIATAAIGAVTQIGDALGEIFGLGQEFSNIINSIGGVLEKLASGDWAGAIISAISSIIQNLAFGMTKTREFNRLIGDQGPFAMAKMQRAVEHASEAVNKLSFEHRKALKDMADVNEKELSKIEKNYQKLIKANEKMLNSIDVNSKDFIKGQYEWADEYYNLLKEEEEERVANMSESERQKYQIEKTFFEEQQKLKDEAEERERRAEEKKKALEKTQAEEEKKLKEKQKEELNRANKALFNAEKKMAIEKAYLDYAAMFYEYQKEFAMPWRKKQREQLQDAAWNMYTRTKDMINSRKFYPALALGSSFAQGGPTLVGEVGPEIVDMPRGARVIPNNRISNTVNNMGQTFSIGTVSLNGVQNVRQLLFELQKVANSMGSGVLNNV